MSTPWIYVEALDAPGAIDIEGDELRHLAARRLRVGDSVVVFDGRGALGEARLLRLERRRATLEVDRVEGPVEPAGEAGSGLVLASAIPKGERLSVMLQMLTQIGVDRWQPLLLDDSAVRKLDADGRRLRRILIEACKVARRPVVMRVDPPCSLDELLADSVEGDPSSVWFGDREGRRGASLGCARLIVIGPEAGFSERERSLLEASGARAVSFGPHNLRIETAAIAGASLCAGGSRVGEGA